MSPYTWKILMFPLPFSHVKQHWKIWDSLGALVEGQQELCPFYMWIPMVMHFVPIFYKRYRSKTNFYVFGYD